MKLVLSWLVLAAWLLVFGPFFVVGSLLYGVGRLLLDVTAWSSLCARLTMERLEHAHDMRHTRRDP